MSNRISAPPQYAEIDPASRTQLQLPSFTPDVPATGTSTAPPRIVVHNTSGATDDSTPTPNADFTRQSDDSESNYYPIRSLGCGWNDPPGIEVSSSGDYDGDLGLSIMVHRVNLTRKVVMVTEVTGWSVLRGNKDTLVNNRKAAFKLSVFTLQPPAI
ncbi:hypothetical protein DXG01_016588 [Tephrocybe rancida]|nr:hypothetical protein DXG01_016588 [Tephrocybe rancida]